MALASAGASFRSGRWLAASRHFGSAPALENDEGSNNAVSFRGSITRPQSSLSTLRSPPRDGPRKTRLPLVASLSLRGIGYPQGTIEVSTIHFMASSSPGLAWRNFHGNLAQARCRAAPSYGSEQRANLRRGLFNALTHQRRV